MAQLARGYSFVMYLADDGADYIIPFPYLQTDDIRVFAGDVGDAVEQSFNWINPTTVRLSGSVPVGILVTIRRFTPRDDSLVHIQEGTMLPAAELNMLSRQLLFVMQEQIDFGSYGGGGLPGGGSGWPNPGGGNPSLPIQEIIDQLMRSPVMGLLVNKLADIDDTAETMMDELLRSDQMFDARRQLDGRLAFAETTLKVIQDDKTSLVEQVTELFAKYDNAAAQVLDVRQALATETEARATLATQLNAAIGNAESHITTVEQAVATETEARTSAITTMRSDFDTANKAIYQTLATTYTTKDQAQVIAQTQVEAFSGGSFANLQQRFEALVKGEGDPNGGEWSANWTVRINAGAINGTPVIAGIGLGVDSKTGSNFIVMADRFGIVSPTYTSNGGVQQMKYPFVVGTVGGVSTVGISGQLLVDGSITADKMHVNSLSALSANMGEVNGGTFRTFQLDGNGNIINPSEFRCEMTNNPSDSFPMWIGAGVKNWNNAVFAVDRSGNAKFAGTITAANVVDDLQRTAQASWSGDAIASNNPTLADLTLAAPVRLGQSHRPLIIAEVLCKSTSSDDTQAKIWVERLDGATWTPIRQNWYTLRNYVNGGFTLVVIDTNQTGDARYRVRLLDNGLRGSDFHASNCNVSITGIR
jgi:Phage T7 tail fibre protein/Domain of unknown function (DUF1983)